MGTFFRIQKVNGMGSGKAYMSALELELRRRAPGASLDAELSKLGLGIQYLEDEYDYWHVPQIYLEHRLNIKSIVHWLELWGYEDGKHIFCIRDDDGDEWIPASEIFSGTCE